MSDEIYEYLLRDSLNLSECMRTDLFEPNSQKSVYSIFVLGSRRRVQAATRARMLFKRIIWSA